MHTRLQGLNIPYQVVGNDKNENFFKFFFLKEILHNPTLVHRLNNTKAMSEVKSLDAFYAMQNSDPTRASYGIKHIEAANEADAIDTLLIADSLLRSTNLSERKRYVKIVENVRAKNGQVKIFSTMHISGERTCKSKSFFLLFLFTY